MGVYTQSTTHYTAGEFTQTVGRKSIGIPSFLGVDVANDLWGDGGDRYRTSHIRINAGFLRIGQALFTGDPGLDNHETYFDENGNEIYKESPYGDPDKYRHGTLYFGLGPIEMGWDSEGIRSFVQNTFHSLIGSPHFKDLSDTDQGHSRPYFQFGWGPMW